MGGTLRKVNELAWDRAKWKRVFETKFYREVIHRLEISQQDFE